MDTATPAAIHRCCVPGEISDLRPAGRRWHQCLPASPGRPVCAGPEAREAQPLRSSRASGAWCTSRLFVPPTRDEEPGRLAWTDRTADSQARHHSAPMPSEMP
jgi:hypothetical protein